MTEAAVVQDPTVTPEPKEFWFEFQPRDENSNPLGGLQRLQYDGTPEDLGKKMAEQNNELIKLNRRLKKDARLGTIIKEEIPENAPRFDESKFQLVPQPLTAEERIQISQDVLDPEKISSVGDRFVRATIGDPEALRTRLARLEQQAAKSNALEEATAFRDSNPDYYVHPDNFKTLANWMVKNGLEPVKENFQLAYDTLKEFMIPKPQAVSPVITVEPANGTVPPAATPNPTPVRPVSSGLTRSNGSDSGPAPKTGYTQAEIDKMSGDEYKAKVLDPEFRARKQQGRA
jgi:hypothetical protein